MKTETDKNDKHSREDHIFEGNRATPYFRIILRGIVGLFFAGAGVYQFIRIQHWEAAGGIIEMNDLQQLLYKLTGKWGIPALLLLAGGVFFYLAYARWKRVKMQRRL
ncbi:hypothetical protein ECE50_008735 [Chitinophaga sp. Mgbs1]|uniref:Uncharacterized protein n=1 Tax=Chitinophaga solisilvae TaxID=1233460 RepID=A0A433WQ81_9BACT|nr:hypothetical protein [Chitinophaga solisilvae]